MYGVSTVCDSARALLFHSCVSPAVLRGCALLNVFEQAGRSQSWHFAQSGLAATVTLFQWLNLLHVMHKVFFLRKSGSKFIANNYLLLTALGQWVNDCLLCLTWNTSCSHLIRNRTLLQKMSLRRLTKHCRCSSHLCTIWIASSLHWSALHIHVDRSIFAGKFTGLESRG